MPSTIIVEKEDLNYEKINENEEFWFIFIFIGNLDELMEN